MATARSFPRTVRDRGTAVPFRLLWPTLLLLFGVALAHGASPENAESAHGHPVEITAVDESGHHADSNHPAHPAPSHSHELCLSGQPQPGPGLTLPGPTPLAAAPAPAPPRAASGAVGGTPALPPLRSATGSVVQQV
ncbi:hypothetical protein ACWC2K_20770 [Streptomyces chattanoogensis]|uniref:hypothetical protein n=1 Tax=Streptomyces chattanoogensis TaxID=66876 RepID=UPI003673FCFD